MHTLNIQDTALGRPQPSHEGVAAFMLVYPAVARDGLHDDARMTRSAHLYKVQLEVSLIGFALRKLYLRSGTTVDALTTVGTCRTHAAL